MATRVSRQAQIAGVAASALWKYQLGNSGGSTCKLKMHLEDENDAKDGGNHDKDTGAKKEEQHDLP